MRQVVRHGCGMDVPAPCKLRRAHCHADGGWPEPLQRRHVGVADGSGEPIASQILAVARANGRSDSGGLRPSPDARRIEAEFR